MDKIIGLGNALVDVLSVLGNESILKELSLPKGSMTLIDEEKYGKVKSIISELDADMVTGGSAGNVIRTLANLGGECGFVGKISNDELGNFYKNSLTEKGITPRLFLSEEKATGVASTFITPDGERTFATYLGAASTLSSEDLSIDLFQGYSYLFIEGYLVQDHEMITRAIELANQAGLQICLDLASYNIVNEDRDFFLAIVDKYVDIIFANEEEAKAFSAKDNAEEAIEFIGNMCSIAIVKMGSKGCRIKKGTTVCHVPAEIVDNVVDTTGAGDFFAGGFLFGLAQGVCLEKCAKIGALISSYVIQYIGAEIPENEWIQINKDINEM